MPTVATKSITEMGREYYSVAAEIKALEERRATLGDAIKSHLEAAKEQALDLGDGRRIRKVISTVITWTKAAITHLQSRGLEDLLEIKISNSRLAEAIEAGRLKMGDVSRYRKESERSALKLDPQP